MGEGITISDEGILGGSNDVMFGGRQRFAQLAVGSSNNDDAKRGDRNGDNEGGDAAAAADADGADGLAGSGQQQERGADGAAMDDDFYQRDVQAEYEELDYDANEQFDDDDVDLGEGEVMGDTSDGVEITDDLDDDLEEEEEEEEGTQGAVGLASLAGFQALLAKARGETPPDAAAGAAATDGSNNGEGGVESLGSSPQSGDLYRSNGKYQQNNSSNNNNNNRNEKKKSKDHFAKIMAAAEQSRLAAEKAQQRGSGSHDNGDFGSHHDNNNNNNSAQSQQSMSSAAAPTASVMSTATSTTTTTTPTTDRDVHGLRIISLEAVRREIWLNYGSIPMKRLMKIFDVKKKSPQERQDQFRDILKELCIMKSDPINGRMLVLKQHYAKG